MAADANVLSEATQAKPSARPLRDEITDLPNLITLARIAMIPLVLVWIDNYSPRLSALSCLVFLIAAVSDALDGYLARRMGLVTVVGKFLDPLADKLIVLSTLVMLVEKGRAPAWLVIALMSRELAVTGLRAIASQRGYVIAAGPGGKMKTALQLVGICFLLIFFRYDILLFDYSLDFHEVGINLLYISLVLSVTSGFEYFRFFVKAAQQTAEEQAERGITRQVVKDHLKRRRLKLRALRQSRKRELITERKSRAAERKAAKAARVQRKQRRRKPPPGRDDP